MRVCPPNPLDWGSEIPMASAEATAASIAFPPILRISEPTIDAGLEDVATIPCFEMVAFSPSASKEFSI